MKNNPTPLADRLWARVEKTETCWLWTGATMSGYGVLGRGRRGEGTILAHRAAYELLVGPIAEGGILDHKCHTRACVNPLHLQVVTHGLNNQNRRGPQSNSATGVRGVYWNGKRGKYVVETKVAGRRFYGGQHDSLADAEAAAVALRLRVMTNNLIDRAS